MKIGTIVVNINNLGYTKACIDMLLSQFEKTEITLVDNGSSEKGTDDYLKELESRKEVTVIRNDHNKPLNWIWNEFAINSQTEYLCFLNNDVIIPNNFISHSCFVLDKEKDVGIVVHATNHPSYDLATTELKYVIPEGRFKQGWDFVIRKDVYEQIPEIFRFYCGDDFLFRKSYSKDKKVAFLLSSPMIHFQGKSTRFCNKKYVSGGDYLEYVKQGYERDGHIHHNPEYSFIKPRIKNIREIYD
jgi:GT2 family glycosyltransferase